MRVLADLDLPNEGNDGLRRNLEAAECVVGAWAGVVALKDELATVGLADGLRLLEKLAETRRVVLMADEFAVSGGAVVVGVEFPDQPSISPTTEKFAPLSRAWPREFHTGPVGLEILGRTFSFLGILRVNSGLEVRVAWPHVRLGA